jgi:hypothetical protein
LGAGFVADPVVVLEELVAGEGGPASAGTGWQEADDEPGRDESEREGRQEAAEK